MCSGRQGRDAESKDVIFFLESLRAHLAAINRRSKENQAQNKKIQDGHSDINSPQQDKTISQKHKITTNSC